VIPKWGVPIGLSQDAGRDQSGRSYGGRGDALWGFRKSNTSGQKFAGQACGRAGSHGRLTGPFPNPVVPFPTTATINRTPSVSRTLCTHTGHTY